MIKDLFDNDTWGALTEYMRFEADVNSWLQENLGKNEDDVQIMKKTNKLLSESEQMKLLVQIKLQAARNSKGPLFNQFKTSGTNLNASMGIGSDVLHQSGESVFRLEQFNQRKIFQLIMGDFHTLAIASGCQCVDELVDTCKG